MVDQTPTWGLTFYWENHPTPCGPEGYPSPRLVPSGPQGVGQAIPSPATLGET